MDERRGPYITRTAKEKFNVEIDREILKTMHSALESAVARLFARAGTEAALDLINWPEVPKDLFRDAMQSLSTAISAIVKGAESIAAAASPLPDPIDRLVFRFVQDRLAIIRGQLRP